MMKVEPHLSDLFFNHNVDAAKAKLNELAGTEKGFHADRLKAEAEQFLLTLQEVVFEVADDVSVLTLPDADDLVRDFLDRV